MTNKPITHNLCGKRKLNIMTNECVDCHNNHCPLENDEKGKTCLGLKLMAMIYNINKENKK